MHLGSGLKCNSFAFIYTQLKGFNVCLFNEKALPQRRQGCAKGKAPLGSVPACAVRDTANLTPAKGFLCSTCFIAWRTGSFLSFKLKAKGFCSTLSLPTDVHGVICFVTQTLSTAAPFLSQRLWRQRTIVLSDCFILFLSQVTFSILVLITGHIFLVGPDPFWGAQPGHRASLAAIWRE